MLANKTRPGTLILPKYTRLAWLPYKSDWSDLDLVRLLTPDSYMNERGKPEVMVVLGTRMIIAARGYMDAWALLVYSSDLGIGWVDEFQVDEVK